MTYRLPFALFATTNMPVRAAGQKPGCSAKSAAPTSFKQGSFSCAFAKRLLPPRACGDTTRNAPSNTYVRPQKHRCAQSYLHALYCPDEARARPCTTGICEPPKTVSPARNAFRICFGTPNRSKYGMARGLSWANNANEYFAVSKSGCLTIEPSRDSRRRIAANVS